MAWNRSPESEAGPLRPSGVNPPTSTIGPSISIQGDLNGAEDLRIEGSVEGTIRLDKQSVVVSTSGRITADIFGRSICVEGQVKGNLYAEKEIIIRPSGKLEGNITAPSVTLENGAKFRGAIDMEPTRERRDNKAKQGKLPTTGSPDIEKRTGRRAPGAGGPAPATVEG